jgi:hypothetical protein
MAGMFAGFQGPRHEGRLRPRRADDTGEWPVRDVAVISIERPTKEDPHVAQNQRRRPGLHGGDD